MFGPARTLLECERVALNFMQRLSGVATTARLFAEPVQGTSCRVLDTRKTMPGLRALEKLATDAGGITNHRMGLCDAILIKNNHIAAAGGMRKAIERGGRSACPCRWKCARARNCATPWKPGAERLLLDNLTPAEAADWIARNRRPRQGRAFRRHHPGQRSRLRRAGADFVSSGAITHSARAMDISFRLELV